MRVGRRRLFTAVVRDITQRKQAQAAVRASARQFRALFEGAIDAMLVLDDEGRAVEANAAASALHGLPREELLGRRLDESGRGFDFAELWARVRDGRRARGDMEVRRADGAERSVEFTVTADFLPGSHLAVLRDVTEARQLESQLRHAQRMEPLGRLAGGVAHDFNNLLNVITGYGEMLRRDLPAGAAQRRADAILKAAERAAGLTHQLLAFSRRQVLQPRVIDLNTVVADFHAMVSRLLGERIRLSLRLDEGLGRVQADPGQVEQVLMNLVVNARDAMPSGGAIRMETRNVDLDERYVEEHVGAHPGPHVLLAVTDDGVGMDEETRRHIFEPFFTTKGKGRGTGLGHATVYGIVKPCGGYNCVESQRGRGTTFQVFLPRVEATLEPPAPRLAADVRPAGAETVLLVEDEAMLRQMIREVLERDGYRVLEAAHGEEALRVLHERHEAPHILVTDVVMPGIGGPALARRVAAARPGIRVLLMSGYTDARLPEGRLAPDTAFLAKPFTPDALVRKVRELLDAPAGVASGNA
jgi:PAS domain S-box-containing protein